MTDYPPLPLDDAVLVMTHMQNEFWHPKGFQYDLIRQALPHPDVIDRIHGLLELCREGGVPVLYHQESFRSGHPELRERRNGYVRGSGRVLELAENDAAVRGTWGTEVIDILAPEPGRNEYLIDNPRVDPFTCSDFDVLLRNLGRHILILVGIATDFGIEMTARSASEHDYGVVILSDCVDRMLGAYSEQTLEVLLPFYGRVTTSDVITNELREQIDAR